MATTRHPPATLKGANMFTRKTLIRLGLLTLVVAGCFFVVSRLVLPSEHAMPVYQPTTAEEKRIDSLTDRAIDLSKKFWAHKESGLTAEEESQFATIIKDLDGFDWKGLEKQESEAAANVARTEAAYVAVATAAEKDQAKASKVVGTTVGEWYARVFLEGCAQRLFDECALAHQRLHLIRLAYHLPFAARYDYARALLVSKKPDKARKVLLEILTMDPQQAALQLMAFPAALSGAADDTAFMEKFRAGGGDVEYLKRVHEQRAKIDLLSPHFRWPDDNPADQ